MDDATTENRVVELHRKRIRPAHPASYRERAAEHGRRRLERIRAIFRGDLSKLAGETRAIGYTFKGP